MHQAQDAQREWVRAERDKHPHLKCLWNTGNVPKGFVQRPKSTEMEEQEMHQEGESTKGRTKEPETVYTDGGCIKVAGGTRAGYGIYWGEGDQRKESRARRGQDQKRRKEQRWQR